MTGTEKNCNKRKDIPPSTTATYYNKRIGDIQKVQDSNPTVIAITCFNILAMSALQAFFIFPFITKIFLKGLKNENEMKVAQ